jgi:hypothetical protein
MKVENHPAVCMPESFVKKERVDHDHLTQNLYSIREELNDWPLNAIVGSPRWNEAFDELGEEWSQIGEEDMSSGEMAQRYLAFVTDRSGYAYHVKIVRERLVENGENPPSPIAMMAMAKYSSPIAKELLRERAKNTWSNVKALGNALKSIAGKVINEPGEILDGMKFPDFDWSMPKLTKSGMFAGFVGMGALGVALFSPGGVGVGEVDAQNIFAQCFSDENGSASPVAEMFQQQKDDFGTVEAWMQAAVQRADIVVCRDLDTGDQVFSNRSESVNEGGRNDGIDVPLGDNCTAISRVGSHVRPEPNTNANTPIIRTIPAGEKVRYSDAVDGEQVRLREENSDDWLVLPDGNYTSAATTYDENCNNPPRESGGDQPPGQETVGGSGNVAFYSADGEVYRANAEIINRPWVDINDNIPENDLWILPNAIYGEKSFILVLGHTYYDFRNGVFNNMGGEDGFGGQFPLSRIALPGHYFGYDEGVTCLIYHTQAGFGFPLGRIPPTKGTGGDIFSIAAHRVANVFPFSHMALKTTRIPGNWYAFAECYTNSGLAHISRVQRDLNNR